jgi:hypothetical protein
MSRRIAAVILACLLVIPFCACGGKEKEKPENDPKPVEQTTPEKGEYLYKAMGNDLLAGIDENKPVRLTVGIDHMGDVREAVFEGEDLDKALEYFKQIQIGDETDESVTDNYNYIILEWDDGSQYAISLNLYNLEMSIDGQPRLFELESLGPLMSLAEEKAVPADMGGAAGAGAGE